MKFKDLVMDTYAVKFLRMNRIIQVKGPIQLFLDHSKHLELYILIYKNKIKNGVTSPMVMLTSVLFSWVDILGWIGLSVLLAAVLDRKSVV